MTEERHGTVMDGITHYYNHYKNGLAYFGGFGLGNFVIGNGSLDTHAQFNVDEGLLADEDIGLTAPALSVGDTIPVIYMSGVEGTWREATTTGFCVYPNPDGATHRLFYNQLIDNTTWQLTEVGEGNYVLYHLFMFSGKSENIVSIMGQATYTNPITAKEAATTEIGQIVLESLPSYEMRPLATLLFQTDKDYANTVHARIIQPETGVDYISWLTTDLPRGTAPTNLSSYAKIDSPTFTTLVTAPSIYPSADDTYYLGKNDDDSPLAWKGVILKDTSDGKYYRLQVTSGALEVIDLTD